MPQYDSKSKRRGGKSNKTVSKRKNKKTKEEKRKNQKARYVGKKFVKQDYAERGIDVKNVPEAEIKERNELAHKLVIKARMAEERKKINSTLGGFILKTPYSPIKTSVQLDFVSLEAFVRAFSEQLSLKWGSFFSKANGVSPAFFRFYCFAMVIIYLDKVGKVTGFFSNLIPDPNSSYQIPNPLAKWMEYLCPSVKYGSRQIMEFNYDIDYQALVDFIGPSDGLQTINQTGVTAFYDYTGSQQTVVFQQNSVPQPAPANVAVPADQPSFPATTYTTPFMLSQFMNQSSYLSTVSSLLQNHHVPCVEFSWLPGMGPKGKARAPDCSAYGALNQPYPLIQYASQPGNNFKQVPLGLDWVSIHSTYDEDVALLFCLSRVRTTQPAICAKALKMPVYDYNSKYDTLNMIPWYIQPMYVASHLAWHCDVLRRGPWKSSLTIERAHLNTLYPKPRFIGGTSLFTLVVHAYQELQTLQSGAAFSQQNTSGAPIQQGGVANDDLKMTNWYWLATAVSHVFQRRFNTEQVVMANCPIFEINGTFVLFNQANYVDSAAQDIEIPKTVSAAIDGMGTVIFEGELLVPATAFANLDAAVSSPPSNVQAYGPIGWSAYGFLPNANTAYPYENIQTMPVANATPNALVPVNAKLIYLTINVAYATTYLGWVIASNTMYPFFFGGQWLQQIMKQLDSFVLGKNNVNTIAKNWGKAEFPRLGKASHMMTETVLNFDALQVEPLLPNNLAQLQLGGLPQSTLTVARVPITGQTSQHYHSSSQAMISMASSLVQDTNQAVSSALNGSVTPSFLHAAFTGIPPPAFSNSPPSGMVNVTVKSGNSFSENIAALTHLTMKPDSQFAKEKAHVDCAKGHVGQLVPKDKVKELSKLNTDKAYDAEAARVQDSAFGSNSTPNITSENLGVGSAKMPDAVATNVAILHSSSTTTSAEARGNDVKDPKMAKKKIDHKHLKALAKVTKKVSDDVGKTIDGLTKVVTGAGKITEQAATMMGSFI